VPRGERFETSGVSESLRVVANLGEQARTGDVAEAGKARDDVIVGVPRFTGFAGSRRPS
jgi:hypothetical protein